MTQLWRGIFKLIEEAGEVQQAAGKLCAFPHNDHPSDKDLRKAMEDELADLSAAMRYFAETNKLNIERIKKREQRKFDKFRNWELSGVASEEV